MLRPPHKMISFGNRSMYKIVSSTTDITKIKELLCAKSQKISICIVPYSGNLN